MRHGWEADNLREIQKSSENEREKKFIWFAAPPLRPAVLWLTPPLK